MASHSDESVIRMATAELVAVADILKRLTDSCWTKCIPKITDPTLNPGEASCVDRCVNKYQDVQLFIGNQLQSAHASSQPQ